MPVHNADIAAAFEEIADLLELGDENPFRVRAYRNAARIVGGLSLDLAAALAAGKELPKLPGIGADLDGKIHEIARTVSSDAHGVDGFDVLRFGVGQARRGGWRNVLNARPLAELRRWLARAKPAH